MLPKKFRFSKRQEIGDVKKKGKLYQFPLFGILVLKTRIEESPRFAFVVSTRISKKSTERNKIRRLLSETIKFLLPKITLGYDLIFLTKKSILDKGFWEINKETEFGLRKIGLVK